MKLRIGTLVTGSTASGSTPNTLTRDSPLDREAMMSLSLSPSMSPTATSTPPR